MNMESGSIGDLSKQNQKSSLEKQLDFQEAVRPSISDEYYTSAIDFLARLYMTEHSSGVNYEAFPKKFREYVHDRNVPYNTIFGNGSIKVAVMKIQRLKEGNNFNLESKEMYQESKKITEDLKKEYGFSATFEYNKDSKYQNLDLYIACFPGKVVKNEKDQWTAKETEGGAAKFFALLVKRGFIDEKVISESGMATLGIKGIKFGEDFKQALDELKKKGLEKIIQEPIHKL